MGIEEFGERLARIETKLDRVLEDTEARERRLRALEDWRNRATATVAVVGIVWVPVCALLVRYASKGLGL